jgi:hypothetical protein
MLVSLAFAIVTMVAVLTCQSILKLVQAPDRRTPNARAAQ